MPPNASSKATATRVRSVSEDADALSGSLAKGLRLVEHLLDSPFPQSLSELGMATGLDNSTAYRLLATLIDRGYVVRDDAQKRYMAGPKALVPLSLLHPLKELAREVAPVLTQLRDSSGETSAIVVFVGTQRLALEIARGAHPLVPYYETWLKSPLHGSASGKILLASLPQEDRSALLGAGPYRAVTPYTETDPEAFSTVLDRILEQKYAVARDDAFVGMTAIAAPIGPNGQTVGCLVVIGRSETITPERQEQIAYEMKHAATLLSHSAPSLRAVCHMFPPRGNTGL